MGWRDYAKQEKGSGHDRHNRHDRPETRANVPNVPIVPGALPLGPARDRSAWHKALSALDPCQPPRGITMGRWQTLYDASLWWLESFGRQAALDGWSSGDVFGIRSGFPGAGGLIDRLGDNRSLVMTAERACWRTYGALRQFNRSAGEVLSPFWECA